MSHGFLVYSNLTICRDGLVIGAGANDGALLVDGLGDGVLLEAADQEFEFLRDTSFNLLQGCRMRNTKTVRSCFLFGLMIWLSLSVYPVDSIYHYLQSCSKKKREKREKKQPNKK